MTLVSSNFKMQLFITDFEQKGEEIIVSNPEIIEQVRQVLRMKMGDIFFVQKENTRLQLEFTGQNKHSITGKILETVEKKNKDGNEVSMLIAMPNKWQKLELIVQKLSEIGVTKIYFRPSERSVLKIWNKNKGDRLEKIAKEAVEQSRGRDLPKIEFITDIKDILANEGIVVFDKERNGSGDNKINNNIVGIVGPEGGLTPKDYQQFRKKFFVKNLGNTILRMETASIIGAWLLKNNKL